MCLRTQRTISSIDVECCTTAVLHFFGELSRAVCFAVGVVAFRHSGCFCSSAVDISAHHAYVFIFNVPQTREVRMDSISHRLRTDPHQVRLCSRDGTILARYCSILLCSRHRNIFEKEIIFVCCSQKPPLYCCGHSVQQTGSPPSSLVGCTSCTCMEFPVHNRYGILAI